MKRRIEMNEVTFYQNPEEGKTVAVIENVFADAYFDLVHTKSCSYEDIVNPIMIPEEFLMPNTIKAISTCHDPDKWDPETGKKQAYYKLLRTYSKMKHRVIDRVIKRMKSQIDDLNKMNSQYLNDVDHYNKLVRYPRTEEGNDE